MTTRGRILLVDDERSLVEMLRDGLEALGFETAQRLSAVQAIDALGTEDFDVVVTDLHMKGMSGFELCERIAADRPDIPVLVLTGFGTMESAIRAIRAGAYDYLSKPVNFDALELALTRAVQHRSLRAEVTRLRHTVEIAQGLGDIVGASPPMLKLFDLLERIGDSDATVLITGESGTGKEVVARTLHHRSRRSSGPFLAINCAAMPETLLESELFGHAKGAFTDAKSAHSGLFVQANRGTLFLDELGDMPLSLQPKLLRALQERKIRPVGSSTELPFDARIISSTNRDLETAVADRTFREDLYFRINVVHVQLPPLRARPGDILLLAQHFLQHFASRASRHVTGFSAAAAEKLLSYSWPGNVRELQNCVERAVALARFDQISIDDLPDKIAQFSRSHVLVASDDPSELVPMEEVERRYITRVLEAVSGNKTMAARVLGFDRTTLYRKLDRYGLTQEAPHPSGSQG